MIFEAYPSNPCFNLRLVRLEKLANPVAAKNSLKICLNVPAVSQEIPKL